MNILHSGVVVVGAVVGELPVETTTGSSLEKEVASTVTPFKVSTPRMVALSTKASAKDPSLIEFEI